jgi:general secretion pathway protein A
MAYYTAFGLQREPFSTSPDPSLFYQSASHHQALTRAEIAIRLRRGLSMILGDVGTGKTTLARRLVRNFASDTGFAFHIILDPVFESEYQFLAHLARLFGVAPRGSSALDIREVIEHHLFQVGVVEGKTTVLVIDEGQKLSLEMLESLRALLNYETNEFKLLQVVIFAQLELMERLQHVRNLVDRVALKYILYPLDEAETRAMIEYRLTSAGGPEHAMLFTDEAFALIYRVTHGYPRRIALLCHDALEALVMYDKRVVDGRLIEELVRDESRWGAALTHA